MSTNNSLDSVVFQKEKEWREAFQSHIKSLQATISQRDEELTQEKLKFKKLKEDFEYNLKLLYERDEELEKYDSVIGQVKEADHSKTAQISELYARLDEMKLKLDNEQKAKEEMQKYYQKRLQEYQNEFKVFRESKDQEISKEREELASFRRNLESQLRMAEDDFECCRQELVGNFDETLRKRDQEYRAKLDETNSILLSNEMKIRSLTKELELVRADGNRCKTELNKTEVTSRELEKVIKEKDWAISDLENTHKYFVADLEVQLETAKKTEEKLREDFQRKNAELDRALREKETMLDDVKNGFSKEERKLEAKIKELEKELESKIKEHRDNEWRYVDKLKENEVTMGRLQQSVSDLQVKLQKENEEFSRQTVAKDLEIEKLLQQESKLRTELAKRRDELERRQKDLTASLEKERGLERARTQLELDWQRRCEEAERIGFEKQEELVTSLTQAKDEALSRVRQQERDLQDKDRLVRHVMSQRDDVIAILRSNGLDLPTQATFTVVANGHPSEGDDNLPNVDLKKQNEILTQIIRQMREDMEELTKQLNQQDSSETSTKPRDYKSFISEDYVASLEKEIREVKGKNRELNEAMKDLRTKANNTDLNLLVMDGKTEGTVDVTDGYKNEIKGLVQHLSDLIGDLRQEKTRKTTLQRGNEPVSVQSRVSYMNDKIVRDPYRKDERPIREGDVKERTSNNSSRAFLQEKLWEAGQRINDLTKEREQLIKMGNKLRSELMKYKDVGYASSVNHQATGFTRASNLANVGRLKYETRENELHYAEHPSINNLQKTVSSSRQNIMTQEENKRQLTKDEDVTSPWQPSFSSDDRLSLQEVWKLLDEESPAGLTPRVIRDKHARESSSDGFTVKGHQSEVLVKPEINRPVLSAKVAGKHKLSKPKARIRNYNIQDEDIREGL